MSVDHKRAIKRLETRKQELTELQAMSEEARSAVELDQQSVGRLSRMDALQGQAMAQEQQRRSCLLYTSPSPRDLSTSRMPSSA